MRFKKLIAAISAAAMLLPALPFIPDTAPVAEAATKNADVTITGAAVVRSTTTDFSANFTGTTALKSAADQIQIFSNRSDVSNASPTRTSESVTLPPLSSVIVIVYGVRPAGIAGTDAVQLPSLSGVAAAVCVLVPFVMVTLTLVPVAL